MSDFKSIELGGPTDKNGQLEKAAEPVSGWPYLIERRPANLDEAREVGDLSMFWEETVEFPVGVLSPELLKKKS